MRREHQREKQKEHHLKIGGTHRPQKDILPCQTQRNTSLFYFTTLLSLSTNHYTCVCALLEREPYFRVSAVRSASFISIYQVSYSHRKKNNWKEDEESYMLSVSATLYFMINISNLQIENINPTQHCLE